VREVGSERAAHITDQQHKSDGRRARDEEEKHDDDLQRTELVLESFRTKARAEFVGRRPRLDGYEFHYGRKKIESGNENGADPADDCPGALFYAGILAHS